MLINTDRPAILLALSKDLNGQLPKKLAPLLYGIEEEQIPVEIITLKSNVVVERAYQAAVASRLSVGISFDEHRIVVHYKNLKPEVPLFKEKIDNSDNIRKLGINAARLVKGVPFKE